jgi:hypothetical protein
MRIYFLFLLTNSQIQTQTGNKQPYPYNSKVDLATKEILKEAKKQTSSLYRCFIVLGESSSRFQAHLGVAKKLFSTSAIPYPSCLLSPAKHSVTYSP